MVVCVGTMDDPFTLTCQSGFVVAGLVSGEKLVTVIRTASTLIALTVASAWTRRKIKRLSLFFAHWLS